MKIFSLILVAESIVNFGETESQAEIQLNRAEALA